MPGRDGRRCVGDDQGNLIFLSIWARDTAVQQFLARLTLGRDEQGLDQFHIITDQGGSVPVFIGNVDRLESASRRLSANAVRFAVQRVAVRPPLRQARQGQRQRTGTAAARRRPPAFDRLWMLVRDTCPLPLLDHWRETVLELLQSREMLARLPFAPRAAGRPSARHRRAGADPGAGLPDPQ